MCLQLFGHRCWQYNPDLSVLFPLQEMCMALEEYLELFLLSIKNAPRITRTSMLYVAYCRTRGAASYPFLVVYLHHPIIGREPSYDTPGERSTLSAAFVGETLMELVGTWRYDVLHTMTFQQRLDDAGRLEPSIVDLLTLAVLSAQWNHTREGYPTTLFLALQNLFNRVITSHRKAPPLTADISHLKCAVIDVFHIRLQCMQEEIDIRNGYRDYIDATQTLQLRATNAELWVRTALLQEQVFRLKLEASLPARVSADVNETIYDSLHAS
ncbi:hypothetical protein DFH07DRAFT_770665 [Mycena maculata]|uniref:Uncharacterized protein n=1 Tax=Mycena maculata TaxID=230809 RepID=A0AAD7NJP5_9AGAR|nr:hypothetical protein DFH07DRAFT_770665 [Mycena maculata]